MSDIPVITGIGVISPIGNDLEAFWESCRAGRTGLSALPFDSSRLPVKVGGLVKDFDPSSVLDRVKLRRTSRFIQFAIVAAKQALVHAQLDYVTVSDRLGVAIGNAAGALPILLSEMPTLERKGWQYCDPLVLPKSFPYMAATVLALEFGARGPNASCVTACSAGTDAIALAASWIRSGEADVAIAGGTEAWIDPLSLCAFGLLRVFSPLADPQEASRPFDAARSGCVPGEGACVVIIESKARAKARGARPLAVISGHGESFDAHHLSAPAPDGAQAARAIESALEDAGLDVNDVAHVNAHATGTVLNDIAEYQALSRVFRQRSSTIPVFALKAITGHCLAASGALEIAAAVMTIDRGIVPPTANFSSRDEKCPVHILSQAQELRVNAVLKISSAMGGHNSCLILERPGYRS